MSFYPFSELVNEGLPMFHTPFSQVTVIFITLKFKDLWWPVISFTVWIFLTKIWFTITLVRPTMYSHKWNTTRSFDVWPKYVKRQNPKMKLLFFLKFHTFSPVPHLTCRSWPFIGDRFQSFSTPSTENNSCLGTGLWNMYGRKT